MSQQDIKSGIVIVGASLAGVSAAEMLRAEGYDGRLVLLSQEKHAPYDRPPLSKEVLSGSTAVEKISLRDADFYEAQGIELKLGLTAEWVDTARQKVGLADGSSLDYQKLLLATGSRVRQLESFPKDAAHVHYLRDVDDALRLRQAMQGVGIGGHVLIIGAGIIGLEVAAVAALQKLKVTVVEQGSRPLARAASPALARFLSQEHERHDVDIRCGVHIAKAIVGADGYDISLSDGTQFHADFIVVGAGVVPNIELAQAAGIETTASGIRVDAQGRTNVDNVYAAGEVAFHYNGLHGEHRREETWQHAISHGTHVARCMMGANDSYVAPTMYWTDQYDHNVLVFGSTQGELDVLRGAPKDGRFLIFHLDAEGICGLTAVNAAKEMRKCKPLVLAHANIPQNVLEDMSSDLSSYLTVKS